MYTHPYSVEARQRHYLMRPGLALCGANVVAIDSSGGIGNTIISARFTVQRCFAGGESFRNHA